MCPLFLRYFLHSYCNQRLRIKWNAAISGSFDTGNGVKQGGALSPLLFNVYLDELILLLTQQTNLRCNNVLATSTFCCDNVNYPRCHNVNLSIPRNVVTTYNITFPID